jgi:Fur family transcriptional regulator, ferric uptake regulator
MVSPVTTLSQLAKLPLIERVRAKGIRLTAQRRILIEEMQNANQHLDASLLLERARLRDGRVDRATVYRTIDLLKKLGMIDELDLMHLNGEKHYYEVRTNEDHLHLACFGCGKIEELTSPAYEALKQEIRARSGFSISVIRLEAGGKCSACEAKEREAFKN